MPHTNKLVEVGDYIVNAQSMFNIISQLPEMARSACTVEMTTGIEKGVMLGLKVGVVVSDRPNEGRFKGTLHFGKDHIKSSSDVAFIQEMASSRYGYFKNWEHLYQLLACHAPSSLAQKQVYAIECSIPFGQIFVNKNMVVFPFSKSDAYQINDTEKSKDEFKSFLDKALSPVDDIDYGEIPDV
jgi:hypothetical protein